MRGSIHKTEGNNENFSEHFLAYHYSIAEESCKKLELSSSICSDVKTLLKDLFKEWPGSRKPGCVVGASISWLCDKKGIVIPKRQVAMASKVSESRLKNAYEVLEKYFSNSSLNKK
ncbi:hypothetical protein FJZ53_01715 [Candidatus Woesearchaeota archaeon]|nr:hypothetical protein [Candidatus Woesearchaeota archaeon]